MEYEEWVKLRVKKDAIITQRRKERLLSMPIEPIPTELQNLDKLRPYGYQLYENGESRGFVPFPDKEYAQYVVKKNKYYGKGYTRIEKVNLCRSPDSTEIKAYEAWKLNKNS